MTDRDKVVRELVEGELEFDGVAYKRASYAPSSLELLVQRAVDAGIRLGFDAGRAAERADVVNRVAPYAFHAGVCGDREVIKLSVHELREVVGAPCPYALKCAASGTEACTCHPDRAHQREGSEP